MFFKSGKFSRTEYEKFLIKSGVTAPQFEANIVEQEKRRQFLSSLAGGIVVPEMLIEKEFRKENQTKTINYIDLNKLYSSQKLQKEDFNKFYEEKTSFSVLELLHKKIEFYSDLIKEKDIEVEIDVDNKFTIAMNSYLADTLFLKKNIKQYDVIVGMYHDQVLAPIKALYGFNAINITLGLPFIRAVSYTHLTLPTNREV